MISTGWKIGGLNWNIGSLPRPVRRIALSLTARAGRPRRMSDKPHPPVAPETRREWERLQAEHAAALREGRFPDIERNQLPIFAGAIDLLLTEGNLQTAEAAVRHLHDAHPRLAYARNLCQAFDHMPEAADQPPFEDDASQDVQIVRREGAELVLLLFCDGAMRLGIPLAMVHRWLGLLPAHLIYLRDFQGLHYIAGVPTLGPDRETTLAALREMIGALGAKRVLCLGNSAGFFGALSYGLDLGAEAVVAMSGISNLGSHPSFEDARAAGAATDMRTAYLNAENPPRALLVYGGSFWDDRLQAEYMADLPTVTLCPLSEVKSHHAVMHAVRSGQFQALLDWLFEPQPTRGSRRSADTKADSGTGKL